MAKKVSLEEELGRVRVLVERGGVTEGEVMGLIGSKHSLVVARGAEMAGERRMEGAIPELVRAFERFLVNGEKTDRGCAGKFAVINALCAMDHRDFELYRRGMKVVQLEASFGPRVDTAAEMRGRCCVALAECGAPGAMLEIVGVLVEKEGQARVGAARAMGAFGSEGAAAVLRLKLLTGDEVPVVLAECCLGLLHISMEEQGDFVVEYLGTAEEEVAVDFLIAVTESRELGMLELVKQIYKGARGIAVRKGALAAAALMRVDGGVGFVLEVMEKGMHAEAKLALEALRARAGDERIKGRVEEVLGRRGDGVLLESYRTGWK